MSKLSQNQIKALVNLVATTQPDEISCEECFGQIGEFAELHLQGQTLNEAMKRIENHLAQCPCCKDEYDALLVGLQELLER